MQGYDREGAKGNWEIGSAQKRDLYIAAFLRWQSTSKAVLPVE